MSVTQLLTYLPGFSFLVPKCVGVDMGSYGIKVAVCSGRTVPISIDRCLWQANGNDLTSGKFKMSVFEAGLAAKEAAFSIADEKVESHEFKLPKLKSQELRTAIDWEVKKAITSPEFAYHDVITRENELGVDVQCVVAAKDIVKSRFDEAISFGFNPTYLETESAALLSLATLSKGGGLLDRAVIIDLGFSAFRLIFVHQGRISFTRSLYLGLAPITETIGGQNTAVPIDMIELFKKLKLAGAQEEGAPSEYSPDNPLMALLERSMQESLYTLCEEFRRSEFFAKDQRGLEEIEQVYLCGGGACVPFTVEYLGKHLSEKNISVLDPFQMARRLPEGVDPNSGPLWACAIGLSLRSVV